MIEDTDECNKLNKQIHKLKNQSDEEFMKNFKELDLVTIEYNILLCLHLERLEKCAFATKLWTPLIIDQLLIICIGIHGYHIAKYVEQMLLEPFFNWAVKQNIDVLEDFHICQSIHATRFYYKKFKRINEDEIMNMYRQKLIDRKNLHSFRNQNIKVMLSSTFIIITCLFFSYVYTCIVS
jgi:hypothetical protein